MISLGYIILIVFFCIVCLVLGYRHGKDTERALIVEWLEDEAWGYQQNKNVEYQLNLAKGIEEGEHYEYFQRMKDFRHVEKKR